MFIWNKDKTFCIRIEDIETFVIYKEEDELYHIRAYRYKKSFYDDMGYFNTKEEAVRAINDTKNILRRNNV